MLFGCNMNYNSNNDRLLHALKFSLSSTQLSTQQLGLLKSNKQWFRVIFYWFIYNISRYEINLLLSAVFSANNIKASKFLSDAARNISYFLFCFLLSLFFFASNTFKKYPCPIRVLFISKRCPQTREGPILAETFPLNLATFHTILSPSHPGKCYTDLLFLFFL